MLNMCYNFNHTKFGTPHFLSHILGPKLKNQAPTRFDLCFFSTCLWFQLPSFYPVSVLHATCSMVDWPDSMKDCGPLEIFLTEPPLGGLRISIPRFAWTDHQSSHKYHREAGELRVFIPGEPLPHIAECRKMLIVNSIHLQVCLGSKTLKARETVIPWHGECSVPSKVPCDYHDQNLWSPWNFGPCPFFWFFYVKKNSVSRFKTLNHSILLVISYYINKNYTSIDPKQQQRMFPPRSCAIQNSWNCLAHSCLLFYSFITSTVQIRGNM